MATTEINNYDSFNRELILDLTLGAFSIYDMSHGEDATVPKIRDYIDLPTYYITETEDTVYSGNNILTDSGGNTITATRTVLNNRSNDERFEHFKFLITDEEVITIAEYNDYDFLDWTSSGTSYNYDSYVITGYDTSGDMMRKKQTIYLKVYCKRTEESYTISGGSVILNRQSSCKVQSQWQWNNSAAQGKWGVIFQAYRFTKPTPVNPVAGMAFDYGDTVIVTKNKLRGRGDALSLYFQSEQGKDMKLLGWGLEMTQNDNP